MKQYVLERNLTTGNFNECRKIEKLVSIRFREILTNCYSKATLCTLCTVDFIKHHPAIFILWPEYEIVNMFLKVLLCLK